MMHPNSYNINQVYRNEQEQHAAKTRQAKEVARTNKKGISVVRVISQIIMSIK